MKNTLNYSILFIVSFSLVLGSCSLRKSKFIAENTAFNKYIHLDEDSLEMELARKFQLVIFNRISADAETESVKALANEDAADDPAIWYNNENPEESLILGTNKRGGLYLYDLDGKILDYKEIGLINNVDLRDHFPLHDTSVILIAGSNRSDNTISLLSLDPQNRKFTELLGSIPSQLSEVYGICMYKKPSSNQFYVIANGKLGDFEVWELISDKVVNYKLVNSFKMNDQPEGIVVDDESGVVYFGIEDIGVYRIKFDDIGKQAPEMILGSDSTNFYIKYDIEGLALFKNDTINYLVVSSQGNFSYALFQTSPEEKYIGSFIILDNDSIDGVEETDGIEIIDKYLSPEYPNGIMVAQDGYNFEGDSLISQNFKIISLDKIVRLRL